MMKKLLFFILFLLNLSSCQNERPKNVSLQKWMEDNGKIKILSTTAMINDIVQAIVQDRCDVLTLIQGNLDPHSYQLVKGDDEKLKKAQLIFYNGLGLEHGASLQHCLKTHCQAVAVGEKFLESYPDKIIKINNQIDPHLWMDVGIWLKMIPIILTHLEKIDPKAYPIYQENAKKLEQEFLDLDQKIKILMQQIPPNRRYLVTSHDAFNYFTKAYLREGEEIDWIKRFQAPEGLAPDSHLSSSDIKYIIEHLKKYQIEVIFPESNLSQDSIYKIVNAGQEKGLKIRIAKEPLYADAMGNKGSSGDTYLKMQLYNAEVIFNHLKSSN